MTWRGRICYLLALLRIHRPDCQHCMAHLTCGDELQRRLEELNVRAQPCSLKNGRRGEFVEDRDSKLPKL